MTLVDSNIKSTDRTPEPERGAGIARKRARLKFRWRGQTSLQGGHEGPENEARDAMQCGSEWGKQ